jgi:hypothetical protein
VESWFASHYTETRTSREVTTRKGVTWTVKSANGKKTAQNKALEKIAALLNQAIEAEIKQAYTGIASQVRGLAEKLEPKSARRAVGRKKVSRRKPVVANKKSERRRGRVKPTKRVAEQTGTA